MDQMKILICTDGSKSAEIAAQELISLRFPRETTCVIFYVVKKHAGQSVQQEIFAPIEAVLSPYFSNIKRKVVEGDLAIAYQEGLNQKLPVILLHKGKPSKKVVEYSTSFGGHLVLKELE